MVSSFNDMTVGMFQEWHKIMHTEKDLLEREYNLLSLVSGISRAKLDNMPRGKIKGLFSEMGKMQRQPMRGVVNEVISIGLRPYVAFTNMKDFSNELTTNQGTALKTWTGNEYDSIQNMHLCLAMLYVPYLPFKKKRIPDNIEKAARIFKKAKVGQVYGTLFFYSRLSEKLQETFLCSVEEATKMLTEHLSEVIKAHGGTLQKATAGIT